MAISDPRIGYDPNEHVDAASLAAFRILFGSSMCWAIARYFAHGWIGAQFYVPRFFFTYRGFDWVRPWPRPWMHVHFAALASLAVAITVGFRPRLATVLFGVGFTWAQLIDKTNYLNHYYLVSVLCVWMAMLPLDAEWSIDAWREPSRRRARVPRWTIDVLRFQVGLVYAFAGLAKLGSDWLVEAQPLRIWLAAAGGTPVVGPLLASKSVAFASSWAAAFFDSTIVLWLLIPSTRAIAYGVLITFHVITAALFPIGLFPWFMTAFASAFLDPSWPRRLLARFGWVVGPSLAFSEVPGVVLPAAAPHSIGWLGRVLIAGLMITQVTIPLRSFLRPGNGMWTEDGFRFSWKVMLMEKVGTAMFRAREPSTGRELVVDPRAELTPVQNRMMATQPDMIAQFAVHVRDRLRSEGWRDPEVRADVHVSFNGRPSRVFVDPAADLVSPEVQRRGRAPVLALGSGE